MNHKTLTAITVGLYGLASLTSVPGDVVGWYRMEGTVGNAVSTVTNSEGTAPTLTAFGDPFNYAGNVAGSHIYDPISGTTVSNTSSFAFTGGTTSTGVRVLASDPGEAVFDVADFTIEMFIKVDTVVVNNRSFVTHGGGFTDTDGWMLRSVNDSDNYWSGTIVGSNVWSNNSSNIIEDGEWHHLAFVVKTSEAGSNFANLYLDYTQIATKTSGLDNYSADVNAAFNIFASGYTGFADEVRFSSSALTPDDFLVAIPEPGTLFLVLLGAVVVGGNVLMKRRSR